MARFVDFASEGSGLQTSPTDMHGKPLELLSQPFRGVDSGALARTVETEIIPRLMLLHREDDRCGPSAPLGPSEIAHFANIVLTQEGRVASAYVDAFQANGASLEVVFLGLLAPTARLLGDLWREDLCSFAEVTIGLSRLQQLLRNLSVPFEEAGEAVPNGRTGLVAPVPGEQHSFGVSVVASFLRRSGWDVDTASGATQATIAAAVRRKHYDLVGFSLSCDRLLDSLGSTIEAVRRASRNPMLKVIVGGRYFIINPHMVGHVGADASALDAKDAAVTSDLLTARLPSPQWR